MTDTIRAVFTYVIALVVVLGGGAIIYRYGVDPTAINNPQSTSTVAIMAGFVGSALTFVFGSEVQTRTARQAAAATFAAGVNGHAASPAPAPMQAGSADPPAPGTG